MKYLLAFFLLISLSVRAENVIQFSGGNYIYAEQGRLIFNLEPNVFKARNWTYDAAQDAAVTDFAVNLPLKTRYTSEWYGYEAMNKSNFHYAAYNPYYNDNIQNIIRPVYMKKAFLPAVAWGIRIGGIVVRNVVPRMVTKCLTNLKCNAALAGLGWGCALNYALSNNVLTKYNLTPSVCEKAEKDGYKKNDKGEYSIKKTIKLTSERLGNGTFTGTFSSEAAAKAAATADCKKITKNESGREVWFQSMNGSEASGFMCYVQSNAGAYAVPYHTTSINEEQKLSMVDIENFVSEDFKDNPNDYINGIPAVKGDKDEVIDGTDILDTVYVTAARIEKKELGGSFSVIGSEPYRDPKTGQTLQDMLTISNAQKDSNAKPSGSKNSGSAAGTSTSYNNVSVTTINRSDVEATTGEGKPNNPNGTNGSGSSSGSGSGSGTGTGEGEDGEEKGNCKEGDKTVGCMPVGDLPEVFGDGENDGFSVPTHEVGELSFDNFLAVDGVCPQPITIPVASRSFEIKWEPACTFAEKIRGLVKLLGALSAAFIVFRRT